MQAGQYSEALFLAQTGLEMTEREKLGSDKHKSAGFYMILTDLSASVNHSNTYFLKLFNSETKFIVVVSKFLQ